MISSGKITPEEARAAFPVALENLHCENPDAEIRASTRERAAQLLGSLKLDPDITVPALIQGLEDPNFSVILNNAQALAEFGPRAKSAIPRLIKAANSTNVILSRSLQFSLKQIENATSLTKVVRDSGTSRRSSSGLK